MEYKSRDQRAQEDLLEEAERIAAQDVPLVMPLEDVRELLQRLQRGAREFWPAAGRAVPSAVQAALAKARARLDLLERRARELESNPLAQREADRWRRKEGGQ